jgi:hypothetical protein
MSTTKRKKAALAVIDDHPPPITDLNDPARLAAAIDIGHAPTVVIDPYQDIKTHAVKIKTNWQKGVGSIIDAGLDLIAAKKDLPRGGWLQLFDKKIGDLPFGYDTAKRLMQIARHPVLSNWAYRPSLPPYWRTLSILSRASETQLLGWIDDGTVNPELEQVKAVELVNPVTPFVPLPDQSTIENDPEVQQLKAEQQQLKTETSEVKKQLDDAVTARLEKNATAVVKLNIGVVLQQAQSFNDVLNNPEVDWDEVIRVAPQLIRDIHEELGSRLDQYDEAEADRVAAETVEAETDQVEAETADQVEAETVH